MAKMIVASGLAPRDVKTPEACFIILASGAELGLSAMQSLRLIHTFNGTVCPAASLLVALVKRSPVCRYFHMVSGDEKESTWETWRIGEPEAERLTYTIEDAKRQGLSSKDNWTKQPKAMLRARASSALARMVYPDVVWGLHASEEMASDVIDTSAKVVDVPEETAPETPAGAAVPSAGEKVVETIRKRGRPRKEQAPVEEQEPPPPEAAPPPAAEESALEMKRRERWFEQIARLIQHGRVSEEKVMEAVNRDAGGEQRWTFDNLRAGNVQADVLEQAFGSLVL